MPVPKSVLLPAKNGAKVRSVFSKRYFVVRASVERQHYDRVKHEFIALAEPKLVAHVLCRSNSAVAAQRALQKNSESAQVVEARMVEGQLVVAVVEPAVLARRAEHEKAVKKAEKAPARNIWSY